MRTLPHALLLLLMASAILSGCSGDDAPEFPEQTPRLPDLTNAGTVSGTVRFEGTAPKRFEISMSSDAWCNGKGTAPTLSEEVVVTDGALQGVLVFVEKGLEEFVWPWVQEPAQMANRNCRYEPHVLAVRARQPVRFLSEDGTAHNVNTSASAQGTNFTLQTAGHVKLMQFKEPELSIAARCNLHPWMLGWIHVLPHPVFVVTAEDGRFTLPPLPPGRYTLAAVHPVLGTQRQPMEVAAKGAATVNFTFKGK